MLNSPIKEETIEPFQFLFSLHLLSFEPLECGFSLLDARTLLFSSFYADEMKNSGDLQMISDHHKRNKLVEQKTKTIKSGD